MRKRRIEIVPMTSDDLEAVMAIEAEAFSFPQELERDWASIDLGRERNASGESEVVAYCNYWLVRDEVHLLNIATREGARRKGHSRLLLEHLVDFARRRQCRYITLEVRRSNEPAIALYKRFGFEAVGIRPKYYVEDNEDALVMLLELGSDSDSDVEGEAR